MGDRAANEKSELEVSFLGEEARFNKNPFQIAYKVKKPIVAYFIVFSAMKTYKVEYLVIELDQTLQAEDAVRKAMIQYVEKYEEIVKKYPQQWFNFYDFWEKK
jgi:predicted LPLAT superfamily acyltransferase